MTALGISLGTDLCPSLGADLCPPATTSLDPSTIIAAAGQSAWFRADQAITLNGSRVSGWTNIWSNGNFAQATASAQPLYLATGINGLPCLQNDDGARVMLGTLSSTIAAGNRAYLWIYGRADTNPGTNVRYFGSVSAAAGAVPVIRIGCSTGFYRHGENDNAGHGYTSTATIYPVDAGVRHLFESGFTTNGTDALVISGYGFTPGTLSATATTAMNTVALFNPGTGTATQAFVGSIAEYVLMKGEPTTQQKADMRLYFRTRYGTI